MPKRNIVWIAVLAVIAFLLWKVPETLIRRDTLYTDFNPLLDVYFQIQKSYVEDPKDKDLLNGAIKGMLSRLDPYSQYFDLSEYAQFQKHTEGQFMGIGVEVQPIPDVGLEVVAPIEGTPAYRAGLRAQDRILKIDGKPTVDMKGSQAVELIQGTPGTSVVLTIERPGRDDPFDLSITRGVITVRTVRGWARSADWDWDYLIDKVNRIGYIRVSGFEKLTSDQLDEAMKELLTRDRMRALVIDLRDNPGGLLDSAVKIAGHFIPKGVIVTTKGRNKHESIYEAPGENVYPDIPMVVLINKGSASASEILSGALRDHQRATLVGETSYGKGSVQELMELRNGRGAIKLTTQYYYLPNGERIHGRGVVPGRIVELTPRERTQMIESHIAVYSTTHSTASQPATRAATAPSTTAPSTASAPARLEILIDRQLQVGLDILKEQLATRPAD